jgi:DNA helicase-2/ATP-dependent DNA helicase PcrA
MTVQLTIERAREIVGFTPSPYQLAVFQHTADQTMALIHRKAMESLIVKAVAGSGKTTTAVAANKIILGLIAAATFEKLVRKLSGEKFVKLNTEVKVIFLAFNKSIQVELEKRLPKNVTSKTLNGLGHGILADFTKRNSLASHIKLNTSKTLDLMKGLMSYEDRAAYGDDVRLLVSRCKALGVAPLLPAGHRDTGLFAGLKGKVADDDTLRAICQHFSQPIKGSSERAVFAAVRAILIAGFDNPAEIDYDDQKYIPTVLSPNGEGSNIVMNTYDLIFVDEAQDVNPVDLELIRLSLREGGSVCAIGDDCQAIYGFRGADVDSIDNIQKTFNAKIVPLSITYRCGKKIVEHLRTIYPVIEAADDAPEGEVVEHGKFGLDLFTHWDAKATESQRKHIHDMIICRNNAPLVQMAFALIRARRQVHMMGRDFGKELLTLISKLVGDKKRKMDAGHFDRATVSDLSGKLDQWEAAQIALISSKNNDETAKTRITDKAATVRVFIEDNTDDKVASVVNEIRKLFHTDEYGDENEGIPTNKIILSSGHKSKGLEALRVFFLDSHLLYQRTVAGTWQHVQEKNLDYVICSRPMLHLGFIYSEQLKAV